MKNNEFEYDVVLSFAGEDRAYVEKVAACLKNSGVKYFYDKSEEAFLWGKDLYTHLADVYENKGKYCVMFISEHYAKKLWTNHEMKNAQARAFKEKQEYILPARFDDTVIPGVPGTVAYIDLRDRTPEQLCELIFTKLGRATPIQAPPVEENFNIGIPRVKRKFDDYEKKKFLLDGFEYLKKYFKAALGKLEKEVSYVKTEFAEITPQKFVARAYVQGELKAACKIWLGDSSFDSESILYLEGTRGLDEHNDSSFNDSVHVETDGFELYFNILGMEAARFASDFTYKHAPKELAPVYFWRRFKSYLEN